jgi:tungstate transport system substrate-binding protein
LSRHCRRNATARAPFVARGDDSGTSKAELRFLGANQASAPKRQKALGTEIGGSGMGPTLNIAAAMGGYTMSDRGTRLNFENRQNLTILVEGDRRLFNQ